MKDLDLERAIKPVHPLDVIPKGNLINRNLRTQIENIYFHPTNRDEVIRGFYEAAKLRINLAERANAAKIGRTDDPFVEALMIASNERLQSSSAELVGKLMFQAYQHTMWKQVYRYIDTIDYQKYLNPVPKYLEYTSPFEWSRELSIFFRQPELRKMWVNKMVNGVISTTIDQRYISVKALAAFAFPHQPIRAIDLGCGMNTGWRVVESDEEFDPIIDKTDETISALLEQTLEIEKVVGIDFQNPDDEDTRLFSRACRYTPGELLEQLPRDLAKEQRLRARRSKVGFKQGNILADGLLTDPADIVTVITFAYQLLPEQRKDLLFRGLQYTKPGGMLIFQDFAKKDVTKPLGLDFNVSWYGSYNYRTFVIPRAQASSPIPGTPLEIFCWNGGRCTEVIPGEDFENFFNYSSSANATLAQSQS